MPIAAYLLRLPCCKRTMLAAMICCAATAAHASIVTLDFDELPATAAFAAGTPIPLNAQLSTQYQGLYGVTFSSVQPYIPVVPLNDTAPSGKNGIGMSDSAGLVSYSTFINAIFTLPGNPFAPAVTDFVSVRGDLFSTNPGGVLTLVAYDRFGNVLATDQEFESPGVTLSIAIPGIHGVQIIGDGSTAFDDFSFQSVQGIPEPATAVLFGLGCLALLGRNLRRSSGRT